MRARRLPACADVSRGATRGGAVAMTIGARIDWAWAAGDVAAMGDGAIGAAGIGPPPADAVRGIPAAARWLPGIWKTSGPAPPARPGWEPALGPVGRAQERRWEEALPSGGGGEASSSLAVGVLHRRCLLRRRLPCTGAAICGGGTFAGGGKRAGGRRIVPREAFSPTRRPRWGPARLRRRCQRPDAGRSRRCRSCPLRGQSSPARSCDRLRRCRWCF